MDVKQLNCPACNSEDWIVVGSQMFNHPEHGLIELEKRECVDCSHRFDAGIVDEDLEFIYKE